LETFEKQFGTDFPETLNASHSILIVASKFDQSSERIINYLSKSYGVNINALTFQHFTQNEADEFIGRVFLIEPNVVQQSSQNKKGSKRKSNLTKEALRELADSRGLGELYTTLINGLGAIFRKTTTTLSSLVFCGNYSKSNNAAIFSLVVTESNPEQGLLFRAFTMRFAEFMEVTEEDIVSCYPSGYQFWNYDNSGLPQWEGHQGSFRNIEDAESFLSKLAEVKNNDR
jgi:hypothetical protein